MSDVAKIAADLKDGAKALLLKRCSMSKILVKGEPKPALRALESRGLLFAGSGDWATVSEKGHAVRQYLQEQGHAG